MKPDNINGKVLAKKLLATMQKITTTTVPQQHTAAAAEARAREAETRAIEAETRVSTTATTTATTTTATTATTTTATTTATTTTATTATTTTATTTAATAATTAQQANWRQEEGHSAPANQQMVRDEGIVIEESSCADDCRGMLKGCIDRFFPLVYLAYNAYYDPSKYQQTENGDMKDCSAEACKVFGLFSCGALSAMCMIVACTLREESRESCEDGDYVQAYLLNRWAGEWCNASMNSCVLGATAFFSSTPPETKSGMAGATCATTSCCIVGAVVGTASC